MKRLTDAQKRAVELLKDGDTAYRDKEGNGDWRVKPKGCGWLVKIRNSTRRVRLVS